MLSLLKYFDSFDVDSFSENNLDEVSEALIFCLALCFVCRGIFPTTVSRVIKPLVKRMLLKSISWMYFVQVVEW